VGVPFVANIVDKSDGDYVLYVEALEKAMKALEDKNY